VAILSNLVALDSKEVIWYPPTLIDPIELFVASKIDAYLFLPPALQEVRDRNLGHVITSQITDRPVF
jgi:hypothetical protein